jgi:DNA-binding NarL/FixJ family response regulator
MSETATRIDDDAQVPYRARLRLLVADDDSLVRRTPCRPLRRHQDVGEASDGSEALSPVRTGGRFRAILMHLATPIMDGRLALVAFCIVAPALARRTFIATGGRLTPELQGRLAARPPGEVVASQATSPP